MSASAGTVTLNLDADSVKLIRELQKAQTVLGIDSEHSLGELQAMVNTADTDKDGTIDLNEVKAAAAAEFDKLDKDKDGTIDLKEAAHHVSKANFIAADADKDKTLTKDEYVGLAGALFKAADKDSDGTVNGKELHTTAGIELDRKVLADLAMNEPDTFKALVDQAQAALSQNA